MTNVDGVVQVEMGFDPEAMGRKVHDVDGDAGGAALSYGAEELPLSDGRVPFGANMAFRTEEQRAFPYNAALGRRPHDRRRKPPPFDRH